MASTIYEQKRFCEIKRCGKIDHLGNVPVMVRNAGQLPQPFWLGAARGGGVLHSSGTTKRLCGGCQLCSFRRSDAGARQTHERNKAGVPERV